MSFAARPAGNVSNSLVILPVSLYVFDESIFTSTATFLLNSDGTYSSTANKSSPSGIWLLSGASSAYETRFVLTSGSLNNGGTLNTWQSLASNISWSNQSVPSGGIYYIDRDAVGILQIRSAITLAVLSSVQLRVRSLSTNV
jgi:hypothetical protein